MATEQTQTGRKILTRFLLAGRKQGEPDQYHGKRLWTRWTTSTPLEVTSDPSEAATPWPATMQNVSGAGIAFWSKRGLEAGDVIYVRELAPEEPRAWLSAHVIHCTSGHRGFLIGAAFEGSP